jgi:hypothetical protein
MRVRGMYTKAPGAGAGGPGVAWAEYEAALEAVWAAPGVTEVDNRLEVSY